MDGYDRESGEVMIGMPPSVAAAIIDVCGKVKQIGVDEKNDHGKYNYVSVDRFYERIGKLMADAGLALLIDETGGDVRAGKNENPWLFAQYSLSFMHRDGSTSPPMRRSIAMPISGPQAYGAAQSYIEKQFLRQVFKVPTGEKDADETAQDESAAPARPRAQGPQQMAAPASHPNRRAPPPRQQAQDYTPAQQAVVEDTRKLREQIAAGRNPVGTVEWRAWLTNSIDAFGEEQTMRVEADLKERASRLDAAYGTAG